MSCRAWDITPVGKPRQTLCDRWGKRKVVLNYRAFADQVRLQRVVVPEAGALVTFVLPMPASWPKAKRWKHIDGPHRQKPDLDNLVKALLDAIYGDDAVVYDLHARKVWGKRGQIIVEVAA